MVTYVNFLNILPHELCEKLNFYTNEKINIISTGIGHAHGM